MAYDKVDEIRTTYVIKSVVFDWYNIFLQNSNSFSKPIITNQEKKPTLVTIKFVIRKLAEGLEQNLKVSFFFSKSNVSGSRPIFRIVLRNLNIFDVSFSALST